MNPPDWTFAIEVHPKDWHFPAGPTWLAGWIGLEQGRFAADLRVWIDDLPFLGLPGLPKPGMDEKFLGRAGPPYAGFVVQVTPPRGARQLRLEVRHQAGHWTELFRTGISVAPEAPPVAPRRPLGESLETLVPSVLQRHAREPAANLTSIADDILSADLAVPLDSLPNPPFFGALEEPRATGQVRYGRLIITGWLAHRSARIRRLSALVDGVRESPLLHGLDRTDIDAVFADMPDATRAQFVGQADLIPDRSGPALLRIYAELDNGEKHLAFAQRFQPMITAGPEPLWPAPSLGLLLRACAALRTAARRHGIPLGSPVRWPAALRSIWRTWNEAVPPLRPSRPSPPAADRTGPLRVLVVTHNLNFEGAPRLVFELTRFLCRHPACTARIVSPREGPMRSLFEAAGLEVTIASLDSALGAETPAAFHAALTQAAPLAGADFDLVIANSLVSFWAVSAARAAGKPVLLYVHESSPIPRLFGTLLKPALWPVVEQALAAADRVTFTAEASRTVFARFDQRGTFRLLPSWLDVAAIDRFIQSHVPAALRVKHGLAPDALILLNLGTVCERKGQHHFVASAALLETEFRKRYPDRPIEFVMVGARPDAFLAILRQQAAEAGLTRVRFVPETRDNFDWLRLADILVCTSLEESSPRVLLEAAAFGLPIVTTDVNGIPELFDSAAARLIKPGDPWLLADALRQAVADHLAGDRSRATNARRGVEQRFDEAVSLPRHVALASETAALYR